MFNCNRFSRFCKILSNNFPAFTVGNKELKFVKEFKYLGTVISDALGDYCDIVRENKMFVCTM